MRLFGKRSAIHNVSDPQPQPSSRIDWPSAQFARARRTARAWRLPLRRAIRRPSRNSNSNTSVACRGTARKSAPAIRSAARWPRRYGSRLARARSSSMRCCTALRHGDRIAAAFLAQAAARKGDECRSGSPHRAANRARPSRSDRPYAVRCGHSIPTSSGSCVTLFRKPRNEHAGACADTRGSRRRANAAPALR